MAKFIRDENTIYNVNMIKKIDFEVANDAFENTIWVTIEVEDGNHIGFFCSSHMFFYSTLIKFISAEDDKNNPCFHIQSELSRETLCLRRVDERTGNSGQLEKDF